MMYDREWMRKHRESVWNEDNMQDQLKTMFVNGIADLIVGFKAEDIPILIDAFEKAGNSHLVNVLREMQDDSVGWDRRMVEKEEEE